MKPNSVIYKAGNFKIHVYTEYSEHKKRRYVAGAEYGVLATGGSSIAKLIKAAIKQYIRKNNLIMEGSIEHSIYGLYTVNINN